MITGSRGVGNGECVPTFLYKSFVKEMIKRYFNDVFDKFNPLPENLPNEPKCSSDNLKQSF